MRITTLNCEGARCRASAAVDGRTRDDVRAAGEALGWFAMARKGGKTAWLCPTCKPSGKVPEGPMLNTGMFAKDGER